MNTNLFKSIRWGALVVCCVLLNTARAQDVETPAGGRDSAAAVADAAGAAGADAVKAALAAAQDAADAATAAAQAATDAAGAATGAAVAGAQSADAAGDQRDDDMPPVSSDSDSTKSKRHRQRHHGANTDTVVSIGHAADLPAGQHADTVVAILGSASSAGDVDDAVVSILGNTRISGGRVGDTAVAVMGSVYVNGEVNGDVVAVMGNVELGPEARVRGDVVVIGGELRRDPAATIDGGIQRVLNTDWANFEWLRPWIDKCLLYGRPLAFSDGLGWAWTLALGLLALYVFIAFLFRGAVERCVETLEAKPGHSILAALLAILLTPVLVVLLCITVLGIAAIPFLFLALFCAAVFGKVVVLAAIGRRCTPMLASDPVMHTVVGVIVGGAIALVLYTIPVIGFIVYKLLGLLGLGVVIYALLNTVRSGRQARAAARGAESTMNTTSNFGDFSAGPGVGPGVGASSGPSGGAVPPEMGAGAVPPGVGAGFTPPPAGPPPGGAGISGAASSGSFGAPPTSLPRATFGIRMGALLLDVILVGIVLHTLHEGSRFELLTLAAYGAVMWKLKGSTVGGIICGLRVVRIDGRPIDWPTAIVRALGCFLSLAVVGLGFLWIAIDSDRQSWHDKIAGTVVVRAPKGASLL